jgi:hypothetical protein
MDKRQSGSRRQFVKKAVYLAPAILTLAVAPSYAKAGSQKDPLPSGRVKKYKLPPGLAKKHKLAPWLAKKG